MHHLRCSEKMRSTGRIPKDNAERLKLARRATDRAMVGIRSAANRKAVQNSSGTQAPNSSPSGIERPLRCITNPLDRNRGLIPSNKCSRILTLFDCICSLKRLNIDRFNDKKCKKDKKRKEEVSLIAGSIVTCQAVVSYFQLSTRQPQIGHQIERAMR